MITGSRNMISGVELKSLKINLDDRGYLMEILRNDEPFFSGFGQCYITSCFPGIVKAWHMHERQEDNICAIKGNIKLVLSDLRKKSPTLADINEFFIGEQNPLLIKVPPGVYHGFTSLGGETAFLLNIPSEPFNRKKPDEHRLPYDTRKIDYSWSDINR